MSVLQPLYFAGGRYTAGTDRKLFAAIYSSNALGERRTGVVPTYNTAYTSANQSMSVTPGAGPRELTISTGLCVIPDAATQSASSPGLFLGGIDTNTETITVPANSTGAVRYDLIYAVVDETSFIVTNKVLTSNVATLTTSTAHGFSVNQTVVVAGIDDIFDGSYVITAVTTSAPYTFSYAKTNADITSAAVKPTASKGTTSAVINNKALATTGVATLTTASAHGFSSGDMVSIKGLDSVMDGTYKLETGTTGSTIVYNINKVAINAIASVAVTNSAVARARVPFSIRVQTGNSTDTNPALALAGTESGGIRLAVVTTADNLTTTYTTGNINDVREFVGINGAVQFYNGNSSNPPGTTNATAGTLRYNTSTNTLEMYDSTAAAFKTLYSNSASGEIFSRSTHNHSSLYSALVHTHSNINTSELFTNFVSGSNCVAGDSSMSTALNTSSSAPTTIATITYTPASGFTGTLVCLITGTVTLDLAGSATQTNTFVGVQTAGSSTDDDAFASYYSVSNVTSASNVRVTIPFNRVVTFTSSPAHTIYLKGYRNNSSNTSTAVQYYMTIVPIRAV